MYLLPGSKLVKNARTFPKIGGSHSTRRRLWKTVYFVCDAVKSSRILPTLPKNLLPQSSWSWRNVSKCDVTFQEAVFWVMISAKDDINTYCSDNLRITYHCHFAKQSNLSKQHDTQPYAVCTNTTRFHLHWTSPGDPEDFVPAIWPASISPSSPHTAEREMDLLSSTV